MTIFVVTKFGFNARKSEPFGKGRRRTGLIAASGPSTFVYDRRGRPTVGSKPIGGATCATGYSHEESGNLTEIRFPTANPMVRQGKFFYEYDPLDRVNRLRTETNGSPRAIASDVVYKPFGPGSQKTFEGEQVDSRAFDSRYRRSTWTLSVLLNYTQTYDKRSNLLTRTDESVRDRQKRPSRGRNRIKHLNFFLFPRGRVFLALRKAFCSESGIIGSPRRHDRGASQAPRPPESYESRPKILRRPRIWLEGADIIIVSANNRTFAYDEIHRPPRPFSTPPKPSRENKTVGANEPGSMTGNGVPHGVK